MYNRLLIKNIVVGISEELPINISFSIADVRDPDKRSSAVSKNITIPGTHEANLLFENIFAVNSQQNTFNPNLKTYVEYYVGNQRIFYGDLQLLKIRKKGLSPSTEINYDVLLVGTISSLFFNLGNALLTDIDFSDLDHTMVYANLKGMPGVTAPTLGIGYLYAFIDYGQTGGNTSVWEVLHTKPLIFAKEYWDRIFAYAGKTYTSTFLNTTYFKRLCIPDVNEGALKRSTTEVNNRKFYAGKNTTTTHTFAGSVAGTSWVFVGSPTQFLFNMSFNVDNVAPFYDTGNVYNTGTGQWTPPSADYYNHGANMYLEIRIVPPAGTVTYSITNGNYTFTGNVSSVGNTNQSVVPLINGTWVDLNIAPQVVDYFFITGGVADVTANDPFLFQTKFFNGIGNPITTGTASIEIREKTTCTYYAQLSRATIGVGSTVEMNNTIPKNVKMVDFITSIMKMENLYMEQDPLNENNYIIEPRNNGFYLVPDANKDNWTGLLDLNKDIEIMPMGDLDAREYIFSYKSDKDKFNKLYEDEYKEVYGTERIDVTNDFIRETKKNELIFSPTPLVGNNVNNLVVPVLAGDDNNGGLKPLACNIRILYYNGLINCNPYDFWFNGPQNTQTVYPYVGHVDNPYNPTIDLCWDNPRKLYYVYPGQTYTNNNLYGRNYSEFIDQITSPDSKILRWYFKLSPKIISEFSFRRVRFVDNAYYYVNKIENYNPNSPDTIMVEMLKLKAGTQFTPIVILPDFNGDLVDGGNIIEVVNHGNPAGLVAGNNNINNGENIILGNNNVWQ